MKRRNFLKGLPVLAILPFMKNEREDIIQPNKLIIHDENGKVYTPILKEMESHENIEYKSVNINAVLNIKG